MTLNIGDLGVLALRHQGTAQEQQNREASIRPLDEYLRTSRSTARCGTCGQKCREGHTPGGFLILDNGEPDDEAFLVCLCVACMVAGIEAADLEEEA